MATEGDRIKKLKEALLEISEGKGAYDMDQLKHAANTIENMKRIATIALKEVPD